MQKQTQSSWIFDQLKNHGSITRNDMLRHYISRGAARVADLREAGHNIVGTRLKNGDYEYKLIK